MTTGIGKGSINIQKKIPLQNRINFYLIKYTHDTINPKEKVKFFKNGNIRFESLSSAIHLPEGWSRHFEH